ncbi:hypothetical protein DH09_11985 [Bacillaceae bacterium JMAK1]|nr:hypothetical protein DH09_11985 [Bacillaceae bacterium JMAK1]
MLGLSQGKNLYIHIIKSLILGGIMKQIIVGSTLLLAGIVLYGFVLHATTLGITMVSGMFGQSQIRLQLWLVFQLELIVAISLFIIGLTLIIWGSVTRSNSKQEKTYN